MNGPGWRPVIPPAAAVPTARSVAGRHDRHHRHLAAWGCLRRGERHRRGSERLGRGSGGEGEGRLPDLACERTAGDRREGEKWREQPRNPDPPPARTGAARHQGAGRESSLVYGRRQGSGSPGERGGPGCRKPRTRHGGSYSPPHRRDKGETSLRRSFLRLPDTGRGGNRTRTEIALHRILSPVRLPVSPLGPEPPRS